MTPNEAIEIANGKPSLFSKTSQIADECFEAARTLAAEVVSLREREERYCEMLSGIKCHYAPITPDSLGSNLSVLCEQVREMRERLEVAEAGWHEAERRQVEAEGERDRYRELAILEGAKVAAARRGMVSDAEVAELREALEPFAKHWKKLCAAGRVKEETGQNLAVLNPEPDDYRRAVALCDQLAPTTSEARDGK